MSEQTWGAQPEEWEALSSLLGGDLWPTVNNPNIILGPSRASPELVGKPIGKALSKVPSYVNHDGTASRLTNWTDLESTPAQHRRWKLNADTGIGAVGRKVKGIDLDIDNEDAVEEIEDLIYKVLGVELPARLRNGSGRRMLVYRLAKMDGVLTKRTIKTASGAVEFLFDKQFIALAGRHHSGALQYWDGGIPTSLDEIPEITHAKLVELQTAIQKQYGTEDSATSRVTSGLVVHRNEADAQFLDGDDVLETVKAKGMYLGDVGQGRIGVVCPWQHQHGSTKGAADLDISKTVLFPPGVGGFTRWGFKCAHTEGHGHKTFEEFAEAIGSVPGEFAITAQSDDPRDHRTASRPKFVQFERKTSVQVNMTNLTAALRWPAIGVTLFEDEFLGDIIIRHGEGKLRRLEDADYTAIQLLLEQRVMLPGASTTAVRESVAYVARENKRDSAIEWANGLEWDGIDRISSLHTDVLGAEDTPYAKAVVRYMFTALAGRCLVPGIKADMIPVLISRQGGRKSTFVEMLSPLPEAYVSINLANRDEDLSRTLRGKLIVESGELRGFGARDEESLKDWITRTKETWVPKYKEMARDYKRRFVVVGTTNVHRFLSDPTGSRRWLPIKVCVSRSVIDTDYIKANLEQLWAQAFYIFNKEGITYKEAELLAKECQADYVRITPTMAMVQRWVADRSTDGFSTTEIIEAIFGAAVGSANANRLAYDVERVLTMSGYEMNNFGNWHLTNI